MQWFSNFEASLTVRPAGKSLGDLLKDVFFFRCINTHNNACHVKTGTQKISSPCSYQANVYVHCT